MVSIKDIFKRNKNESKDRISDRELKTWFERGLKKGYSFSRLREILINRGLIKEANRLIEIRKSYFPKKREIILLLFASIFMLTLVLVLIIFSSSNLNNEKISLTGKIISEAELPGGAIVNVNFDDEVGVVRDDFYGIQSLPIISPYGKVSNDNTCIADDFSNYELERIAYNDLGYKVIRSDAYLSYNSISEGIFNESMNNDADIRNFKSLVIYAYDNGYKIHFVAGYMPEWLANKTSGYCTSTDNWAYCSPTNYTKFGELVVDYLDYVTEYGLYSSAIESVEVWNEPAESYWLNNLSRDNIIKATEYIKLYNTTYDAVKSAYPNIAVGGPSTQIVDTNMFNTFLSNMTTKMDFISTHNYHAFVGGFNNFQGSVSSIKSSCIAYSANCSWIFISEWNMYPNIGYSYSNFHSATINNAYINLLNNDINNVTSILHLFSLSYKNISCSSIQNYSIFSQFEPTYTNIYKDIKNFATYHSAGSTVVKSNSSSNNIKVVASKKGNSQYITVINTGAEINVGINIFGENASQIKDLETNETYNVTNGGVYIGNMSQYEIRYFIILYNPASPEEEPEEPYNPPSGGSNSVDKILEKECNETYLSTKTCEDFGYVSGTLSYGPECTLDTSNCIKIISGESDTTNPSNTNPIIDNEEYIAESDKKTGKNKTGFALFNNQETSPISYGILFSLIIGILILIFYIVRMFIRMKKYNNLRMMLLT